MQGVLEDLKAAETLIRATPVDIPLPGVMQNFINLLRPLIVPVLENRGRPHPCEVSRGGADPRDRAGVHGRAGGNGENMGTVVRIAEELARDAGVEFCGALLRPHASLMKKKGEVTEGAARSGGENGLLEW